MSIALGGLATGLDTDALIQRLLALQRRPVTLLQQRQQGLEDQATAIRELDGRLLALETAVDALRHPASFFARAATSSAESVASATAQPGTGRGTYTLTVTSLAQGSIATATATVAALTDVVASGDGVLEFQVGPAGPVVSVPLTAATTLADLVGAINDEQAGVRASTVNAGTADAPLLKLVLMSEEMGAASDLAILADGTTLGVATTQTGQDATFAVAGLGTFTRPANTFADVIEDVTVTLHGPGAAVVSVGYDEPATTAKLEAVVAAYNDVIAFLASQTAGTAGADGRLEPGLLSGDGMIRQIRRRLAADVATVVAGAFRGLAQIGVRTERDGTLAFDATRFRAALAEDPQAVATLVAGTATADGVADRLGASLESFTKAVSGTLALRQTGLGEAVRSVQTQIDAALARLGREEELLRARFAAMEAAVARMQQQGNALLGALQGLGTSTRSSS